ncbi:Alpha/beta hydrolase family protein [Legionella nautarum]|uniref:Alpha/beta hydrolase family protein n=1 Tax=Legionella nautarum TaxID=45070 RepID=A0A0W0WWA3_9GAMM|nr:Alpha/beta hydrolase family protein [Legionella nautarum]
MFGDLQRMQKNLHNFFDYSNSMASLWTKYFNVSLEKANDSAQLFMELVENQLQPNPNALNESMEYATDFFQRQILFWDVLRKRGNQYLKHEQEGQPPVLIFPYQILMDGRTFEHPVNYALAEIFHPSGREVDPSLRPYVIVDPRAGHGAGISGFKDKSQVGIALEAGHPVYVVIFFPNPEPNQTLLDVAFAHELFLREVALRHPNSPKPCIIGNCQGGWAALSLVAAHPDVAGVAVINGAPLSYWGGANGKNPMRYIGGILGGSWIAQLAGDLGNGKFDGANLVLNFELSNPQNTYWKKYYKLFANIDTEETRFLNFERWWGGFSLMNANEMRGIIDNLFIGNKLVKGKIPLGESGHNLDLRDIKVPVIVFCSAGDTITPPQQALNWIADLYDNTLDIKLQGQVIVYLIHERIGHLGIFVSGEVAQKEQPHL